jgi:terminase small subunit / prophage DNA-packing protein
MNKVIRRGELSRMLGVSLTTLDNWVRNGCPHKKEGRAVLFNLSEVQEYLSHREDGGVREDILVQKLKYQTARSRREELEVLQLEGKLVNLDKLGQDLSFIFVRLRSALLLWEKRLPGLLEGKDQKSMYKVIHKETYDILTTFSKGVKSLCKVSKRQ